MLLCMATVYFYCQVVFDHSDVPQLIDHSLISICIFLVLDFGTQAGMNICIQARRLKT